MRRSELTLLSVGMLLLVFGLWLGLRGDHLDGHHCLDKNWFLHDCAEHRPLTDCKADFIQLEHDTCR